MIMDDVVTTNVSDNDIANTIVANQTIDTSKFVRPRKTRTIIREYEKKIGRNDPCPCGSGKKYKNCCLKTETYSSHYELSAQEMSKVRNYDKNVNDFKKKLD